MLDFLQGIAAAGSLAVGLFFLRSWRETRDRFFVLFAFAFWFLALNAVALLWADPAGEHRHFFYLIRLLAFLLIIAAIVGKNRSGKRPQP
jgi:peptidoglycan/LPS O-acetylase OafA/YrhL